MDRELSTEAPTCPSCGAPRLGNAWDCARCGAVFDRHPGAATGPAPPAATTPGAGPQTAAAPRSSSARRSRPSRRRPADAPTGSALAALRDWVDANKAVAVIISFIVYVGVVWLFGALVVGGTDAPGAVKGAYREVTGRPLPAGFGPAFAAHFVGRRLVVLDRPDQILLVLYKDADTVDEGELRALAERVLDLLEVPWEQVTTRTATVGGGTVEVPVLRLIGEGGPHLYLVPTATADGSRAIEAVIGAPGAVLDVVDEMVRRR